MEPPANSPESTEVPTEAQLEQGPKRVEGLDRKTVELKREYEAQVEKKVASDYSHIVWAYGIIWTLFAIYGMILWRRSAAQRADLEALEAKLRKP